MRKDTTITAFVTVLVIATALAAINVATPVAPAPKPPAAVAFTAQAGGTTFFQLWEGSWNAVEQAVIGVESQGYVVFAIDRRYPYGLSYSAFVTIYARAGGITSGNTSPFGTGCPGYPTPPSAGMQCYADGGWR